MVDDARRCSTNSPSRATSFREEDPGVAAGVEAEIDLHRRAAELHQPADPARPHHLRAGRDHDRPAVVERAEPAEHPGAHRGRPQDPPRLHRDARAQAGLGRLFADRAAAARRDRRHSRAEAGVPRRARHSRDDGVGNVRRADQGHAERDPPPRQGDQFRHHLRHLGVRPRQPARHRRARKPPPTSRSISSASPASAPTWTRRSDFCREQRLCRHAVRPQDVTIPTSRPPTPRCAPSTSAPRSTRGCRAPPPTSSAAP